MDREIKRELPKEWKGVVPTRVFLQESRRIVEKAEEEDTILRILGGLGIAIHCQEHREFAEKLGRIGTGVVKGQEYSDIDYVSYRKQRRKITKFFDEMGYAKRRATLSTAASERQIYYHPKGWFYVDVFFDKLLVANHPISFKGRLELDYPTIAITDLLLEKVQMWEVFSQKDLKDCLLLLRAHDVKEEGERESIDASYMAKLLAKDWGFWYTVTTNLKKLRRFIAEIDKLGPEVEMDSEQIVKEDREDILRKIEIVLQKIDDEPKSFGWKMRAKVGTRKRWYNPVERPETVGGFGIWEALIPEENQASETYNA